MRDIKGNTWRADRHDARSPKTGNQIHPAFLLNELAFVDILSVLRDCIDIVGEGGVVGYIFRIKCSVSRTAT